jgi:hypothetical protein
MPAVAPPIQCAVKPWAIDPQTFAAAKKKSVKPKVQVNNHYQKGDARLNVRKAYIVASRQTCRTANNQIPAQDIHESPVHTWTDLVKLGDKGMLQPVDKSLAPQNQEAWRQEASDSRHRREEWHK